MTHGKRGHHSSLLMFLRKLEPLDTLDIEPPVLSRFSIAARQDSSVGVHPPTTGVQADELLQSCAPENLGLAWKVASRQMPSPGKKSRLRFATA